MNIPQSAHEFEVHAALTLKRAEDLYAELVENGSQLLAADVLQKFDTVSRVIEQISAPASLFSNVSPDEELRTKSEEFEQQAHQLYTKISLDKKLFEILNSLDVSKCSALEQRLHTHIIRDYRRSGVDKDDATRERITALNAELVEIGQKFERNIRGCSLDKN
ncbi:MAG: hypothetical protein NT003_04940 [Candidatus Magasanikbacteria bacterium]|nr:hypothetical protein [Candidatus Magasanikbacteria bacterium]